VGGLVGFGACFSVDLEATPEFFVGFGAFAGFGPFLVLALTGFLVGFGGSLTFSGAGFGAATELFVGFGVFWGFGTFPIFALTGFLVGFGSSSMFTGAAFGATTEFFVGFGVFWGFGPFFVLALTGFLVVFGGSLMFTGAGFGATTGFFVDFGVFWGFGPFFVLALASFGVGFGCSLTFAGAGFGAGFGSLPGLVAVSLLPGLFWLPLGLPFPGFLPGGLSCGLSFALSLTFPRFSFFIFSLSVAPLASMFSGPSGGCKFWVLCLLRSRPVTAVICSIPDVLVLISSDSALLVWLDGFLLGMQSRNDSQLNISLQQFSDEGNSSSPSCDGPPQAGPAEAAQSCTQ